MHLWEKLQGVHQTGSIPTSVSLWLARRSSIRYKSMIPSRCGPHLNVDEAGFQKILSKPTPKRVTGVDGAVRTFVERLRRFWFVRPSAE